MITNIIVVLLLQIYLAHSQDQPTTTFSHNSQVIMLNEQNFDSFTKLGWESIETPWFVFFYTPRCSACPRLVPIWESLTIRHSDTIHMAALDGYCKLLFSSDESPNLVNRFGVTTFPLLMYYAPNNKMYRFDGMRTEENITDFVVHERWQDRIEEGEDIPTEVDLLRHYMRKITHPVMIPIVIVVCFLSLVVYICLEDRSYEKAKMVEAKLVKIELMRRAQVKRERAEEEQERLLTATK